MVIRTKLPSQIKLLIANGKKYYPLKDVLIFDIETSKINKYRGITPENSKHQIWGAYSYNTNKIYLGKTSDFQSLVNQHKILVGHNIKGFDIPIMKKDLNINFWGKVLIDTLEVLRDPPSKAEKEAMKKKGKKPIYGRGRNRIIGEARQIGMIDKRFPNLQLATLAKHGFELFGQHEVYNEYFSEYKDEDFDYEVLNIEEKTEADWKYIEEYLIKDIKVTKNIFEFLNKYFESFAEDLSDEDVNNMEYMHASMGKYVYKCITNKLGLEEKYGNAPKGKFPGAFVFLPTQDRYTIKDGDGYCIDFASQHPSHIRMMGLCTPATACKHKVNGVCPTAHSGDGTIFSLKGTYCACELGPIEKLITKWYMDRRAFKKVGDPREYSVKIKINGTYGMLSSPIFESTYYEYTGEDTTRMSKQSTQFMDRWMQKGGYIVTYGDTDSLYIMDPFFDKQKMKDWMNKGIKQITDVMPFADKYYIMDVDAEFTNIYFFQDEKSKDKHYKKKNYIYIAKVIDKQGNDTGKRKVKINGLPILKRNAPILAKTVYLKYLDKLIIETNNIKFEKEWIKQLIHHEIEQDMNILLTKIKVNPAKGYSNPNIIQAQISRKYFENKDGIFEGIKHTRKGYGVGQSKFYCTLDEAKTLRATEYDLETVWKVLSPFIKVDKQLGLGNFVTSN